MPTDVEEFFDGKRESDSEASESPAVAEPAPVKGETPEVVAKPEVAADDDKEEIPRDVAGLRTALAAARGDKRTARAKWREVEKALESERKQREEERHARAKLEGELTALRQHAVARPQAKSEPEADPEDLFWQKGPGAYLTEREQKLMQQFESRLVERERREFERERGRMKRQYEDFEPAEKAFLDAAKADPSLFGKAEQSGDALQFIYNHGKDIQRIREYGEVTSLAELEAKIRERLASESSGQAVAQTQPTTAKAPIPTKSIAGARGSGASINPAWSGPRAADSFFTGPKI